MLGGRLASRALGICGGQLIADETNTLYFSAARIWELTIKGAERTGVNATLLRKELIDAGYLELPITSVHGLTVDRLPNNHRDPFDRIMLARRWPKESAL